MPNEEQPSELRNFAALLGSKKGTHPIPPDQYLSYQDKRYGRFPALRLWSWLVEHSIAPGHRKGPATDHGRLVKLTDAAKALKMNGIVIKAAWKQLEQENRVRREKTGALWISGDFVLGEEKAMTESPYNHMPAYLLNQINNLPKDRREALMAEEEADLKRRDLVIADLVATARYIFDQRQNSRLASFGVKIKREKQKAKQGKETEKAERDRRVLKILPIIENVVQPLFRQNVVQSSGILVQPSVQEPENAVTVTPPETSKKARSVLSQSRERFEKKTVGECVKAPPTHSLPPSLDENGNTTILHAEAVRAVLLRTLAAKLKKVPDARIVWLVLEKLGLATVESLEERIMLRLDSINSYGMVPALAADAASAASAPPTPHKEPSATAVDALFRERMMRELQRAGKLEEVAEKAS